MYKKVTSSRRFERYNRRRMVNEAFFNKYKKTVYDEKKDKSQYASNPLKDDVDLYDVRLRLEEIWRNCNPQDIAIARKQISRLYGFVDAMINQGFYITR